MANKTEKLNELKGLGPKSVQCLNEISIYTKSDLEKIGPVCAFLKLKNECQTMKPSLNILYAMIGALEDTHWKTIAKNEKIRLLMELEDYQDLETLLKKVRKHRSDV